MPRFTEGELEVMKILWEEGGELKPPEVQERFPRPIKDPALRSYLRILVEKGHVARRRVGKAFYYRARTRQESAFRSMYRQLLDTFCGGSPEALVARLMKSEELSPEEIEELKRLAEEETPDENQGGGRS